MAESLFLMNFSFSPVALISSSVNLGMNLVELTDNVSGVAVQSWAVTVFNLTWMVHDDNLSGKCFNFGWRVYLDVISNVHLLMSVIGIINFEYNFMSGNSLARA